MEYIQDPYGGEKPSFMHIDICVTMRKEKRVPKVEWVHQFIHIFNTVPTNCYMQQELRRTIVTWPRVMEDFLEMFRFESDDFLVDCAL